MRSTSRDLRGREGKEAQERGRLCAWRPREKHPRVLAAALARPPPRGPLPSVRAGALSQALHFPAPPPCAGPAARRACSLLATFFNVSPAPKTLEAGEKGGCDPHGAALDLQGGGRLGELWGGVQGEPLGSSQQVPLSPFLLAGNTNNLLDLQESDKLKALVSVWEAPPREGVPFVAPSPCACTCPFSTPCSTHSV